MRSIGTPENNPAKGSRRLRIVWLILLGIVLVGGLGGLLGYLFIPPVSIGEEAIASAQVTGFYVKGAPIPIDVSDPSIRLQMAGLINSVRRWHGVATEGMIRAELEVTLADGLEYHVVWWTNDDLEMTIGREGEDLPREQQNRFWLRSADARRFREPYFRDNFRGDQGHPRDGLA
jgi:hypothetical protein